LRGGGNSLPVRIRELDRQLRGGSRGEKHGGEGTGEKKKRETLIEDLGRSVA